MLSLQRLLGHDKQFFDLLEASAQESHASVLALKQLLQKPDKASLEAFAALRRKDKRITNEIHELLCRTFVTALEREDIQDLASALYKIPKIIEKFAERLMCAHDRLQGVDFTRHTALLEEATATLIQMLKELRAMHLREMVSLSNRLREIEAEGDRFLNELHSQLYSGKVDPLNAIILKDLYELLEKALDRSRSAGNVMARIALKHS
ncbi:pit accessory protein [Fontisphaera persica]|uniref:DUF47 domain-containing protein n=1 Tax=Fontisphaera persica TaxID=2974023 RepID=UPI0024C07D0D|nr:pit accessory protein [Fontisphaera persica]WCJ60464.1 pit accessory protein [Fontisphaera persica]